MSTQRGRPLKVLIFSPRPVAGGGVGAFTCLLQRRFGCCVVAEPFLIGRRAGAFGRVLRPLLPIYDVTRLILLLLGRRHDVYHVNPSLVARSISRDGLFLIILFLFNRRNVLVFVHGWNTECYRYIASHVFARSLFRAVFGSASRLVVLASTFARDLGAIGISSKSIRVMSTMFDGKELQRVERKRSDKRVRVIFLARIIAAKGIFELLEAFRMASSSVSELQLIVAGDGPDAQRAWEWCMQHQLESRVQFHGYVSGMDKAQLLVDSDIFVLPSSHGEGCPIALLEAMAAGLPVIVSDVGGIPDVVRHGENGVILQSRDSYSIAAALSQLVEDASSREEMGRLNRQQAWEKFEAGSVAATLEAQYRDLSN